MLSYNEEEGGERLLCLTGPSQEPIVIDAIPSYTKYDI